MKKEIWVISLGGSRIAPGGSIDDKFIEEFKYLLLKYKSKKFVVVTGGGSTARKYINALRRLGKSSKKQSLGGIAITRMHAQFLFSIFGKSANDKIPYSMKRIKNLLGKNKIVTCGALRYKKKNTSDGTAADIAAYLNCPFINITNIKGLYTSNPRISKSAKFIKKISWNDFNRMAQKIKYRAGQHFVLDQNAAKTIKKHKIKTYIIGSLKDLENIIKGNRFSGTLISD